MLAALLCFVFLSLAAKAEVSPTLLTTAIGDRVTRVEEFRYLRAEAEKLGVRVWLFGGTAAAYGHYVNWDLRREAGEGSFDTTRFDYDYTNIFRSNQDLDLVVDGPAPAAEALQKIMEERFGYLLGNKSAWEVRLLKESYNDKLALLDNPDFLDQHTDSNSTGMIEITKAPPPEPSVRDLRDWNSATPFFLEDIRKGELHYYFSERHASTRRAAQGLNPPILSVIRYLTKAFQYDLKMDPENAARIAQVVKEFDPYAEIRKSGYVASWIGKNGKKLFQNAVNIEYAWKLLEELGLREKLILVGNPNQKDNLAWWMRKQPLMSLPLGEGSGATAAELGITEVAHETNDFAAYESITRSPLGAPNVFISRHGFVGEMAALGDGFYTKIGENGSPRHGPHDPLHRRAGRARGQRLPLLFRFQIRRLHEQARAARGSRELGPRYRRVFRVSGGRGEARSLRSRPPRKIETAHRREAQLGHARADQKDFADRAAGREVGKVPRGAGVVLQEWFALPASLAYPGLLEDIVPFDYGENFIFSAAFSQKHWAESKVADIFVHEAIKGKHKVIYPEIARYVLPYAKWAKEPELVEALLEIKTPNVLARTIRNEVADRLMVKPYWENVPNALAIVQKLVSAKRRRSSWRRYSRARGGKITRSW